MSEFCEHETFKDICGICHRDTQITSLRAEHERLREWNREIALNARELVAEIERLRAALKPFVCDCEGEAICIGECMHRNARAACLAIVEAWPMVNTDAVRCGTLILHLTEKTDG